ncbi:uncharacterized protein LOC111371020 [Olea europaea var. sylvestris]|uniref:uncharacterized protein LOC111371020 n=1 Tax=Olea europaea var. sylvestris TaxID=158386 RepID=UPI000C1D4959|nr:uncharacterized protein LOC111371020 [Olea europaea var. sylvestris]
MKLNPLKCTFGVASGQFLGYIVNQRGIEDLALKKHLGEVPLLSKPQPEESLPLYLVILNVAVSVVLVREENECQVPVYYVSKALFPAETCYPDMEKLALALITASRKLRPYFQAHSIEVLTNFPLKQVLQRTDASGRLLKWAIEINEFDLLFRPRHAVKGQALANFMVEFAKAPKPEATMESAKPPTWKLFLDRSLGETGSRVGIVLESPEGHNLNCAVWFDFKASNNGAEYEALLAGLRLAKEIQVRKLLASSDSQLIVNQINGSFAAKDSNMVAYLKLVSGPNVLSKLASNKDSELLNAVPIEHLSKPSISRGEEVFWIEGTPLWMQPIIAYLKDQTLPASRSEVRKLRRRAAHFVLQEDMLYKRGFASLLLRCVEDEEATYILGEIHEEICGNHSGGAALLSQTLSVVTSPWPFTKWGIDFIGSLLKGRGSTTFAIVTIDYFTNLLSAENALVMGNVTSLSIDISILCHIDQHNKKTEATTLGKNFISFTSNLQKRPKPLQDKPYSTGGPSSPSPSSPASGATGASSASLSDWPPVGPPNYASKEEMSKVGWTSLSRPNKP